MKRIISQIVLALAVSMTLGATETFDVTINTTPLDGIAGYLALDLTGGTPVESNVIRITNFNTDASLGTVSETGGASGSLPADTGTLNDSQFFNEILQPATYGKTISFDLTLTTYFASSGTPDNFSLYLLDSGENPYATTDPSGADSLISINMDSATLSPLVYTSVYASATVTLVTGPVTAPEPGGLYLLCGAMLVFVVYRAKKANAIAWK